MELKGKKIAFLGDSITEGRGATDLDRVYWKLLEQWTGAECYGYGIGGTRIAPQRVPSPWDWHFASRVKEMIPDADIVVVFGGTNDFGHGDAAFGTMADRTEDTFYGSLHLLYQKLIERYPAAQLVVLTPLHRLGEADVTYTRFGVRRCGTLEQYVDAIREVSAYYAIPVLDLFRVSGIQPNVRVLQEKYMPDGVHPNDAGYRRIAEKLLGFLQSL